MIKKWVNGTRLKYYFYNSSDGSPATWRGNAAQMNVVKQAFATWKNQGIGLKI